MSERSTTMETISQRQRSPLAATGSLMDLARVSAALADRGLPPISSRNR